MNFSSRIRLTRNRAKLTQTGLAENIGVQRSAVSNWEAGTSKPSTFNLIAVAKAMDVSFEWLATGRGPAGTAGNEMEEVLAVDSDLVDDPNERDFLANFRSLSHSSQLLAIGLLKELAKGRRPKGR